MNGDVGHMNISNCSCIDGGVHDVPADVSNLVGLLIGSPVRTLDPSAVFIDVVLKQPNPQLMCRQEIYLITRWTGSWS